MCAPSVCSAQAPSQDGPGTPKLPQWPNRNNGVLQEGRREKETKALGTFGNPRGAALDAGVSRGHWVTFAKSAVAGDCPSPDTSLRPSQTQRPLLHSETVIFPRCGCGWRTPRPSPSAGGRPAQQPGHRRVKAPRLQRKSGSGCSGLGSTETRRRAPRWVRGMQSETRTSRARPSLKEGGQGQDGQGSAAPQPPPRPETHPWQCAASTPTSSPMRLSSGGRERCRHTTRSS